MERYDVDGAGHHLRIADQRRRPGADPLAAAAMALVKSRRLQARGELRGAARLLEDASVEGPRTHRWLVTEIVLARAQLMIIVGRSGDALRLVHDLPAPDLPRVRVTHAAALVADGDSPRAREVLQPVLGTAGLPSPVAVEGWLVMATVAAQDGEIADARRALGQALRCAIPEAQRRVVHRVWLQLRRLCDSDELLEQHRLLQGAARGAGRPDAADLGPVLVEALSRREMEVLQGIAAMLPTEEIAARLFVSINTVKTHVRSILRKLSASRRNEAVRRARSLGLI
jgi:LuxR family maltose regulon positive regulatory protein